MTKKDKAVSILNSYIKKTMELDNIQSKETLNEFLALVTDEYLQAYEQHDMKALGDLLEEQRGIRKGLTEILRAYTDYNIVVYSKLVQTYNIFNKIFCEENEKEDFNKSMEVIERTYKHMWDVVEYLYKHSFVQHKTLWEELNIPKSSLSNLMDMLINVECVDGIKQGKCSFYNLTNSGRKYVKERRKGIDEEIIIDADSFRAGSQKIVNSKKEFFETNLNFKVFVKSPDKIKNEERMLESKWGAEPRAREYMCV